MRTRTKTVSLKAASRKLDQCRGAQDLRRSWETSSALLRPARTLLTTNARMRRSAHTYTCTYTLATRAHANTPMHTNAHPDTRTHSGTTHTRTHCTIAQAHAQAHAATRCLCAPIRSSRHCTSTARSSSPRRPCSASSSTRLVSTGSGCPPISACCTSLPARGRW